MQALYAGDYMRSFFAGATFYDGWTDGRVVVSTNQQDVEIQRIRVRAPKGDFDGDGKSDITVFRPSTAGWYFLNSSTHFTTSGGVIWGASTNIPVPGDYDSDGRTDAAVFRPSTGGWYFLKSSSNYTTSGAATWGVGTDTPINQRP